MSEKPTRPSLLLWVAFACALLSGCGSAYKKSLGPDTQQPFSRIYLTDFNTAWKAVLEALKSSAMDITNREAGFIQTRWADNTAQKNFIESFGNADSYLNAKYRFKVTVSKGYYNGNASVKVTLLKEQIIQRDVLEGWRPIETDSVEEQTFLYRVGRIITIQMKLAKIEEERIKKHVEDTKF